MSHAHDAPDCAPDADQRVQPTASADEAPQRPAADDLLPLTQVDQSGHSPLVHSGLELSLPIVDARECVAFIEHSVAGPVIDLSIHNSHEWVGFAAHQ